MTNRLSELLLAATIACTIGVSALPAAAEDIVAPDHARQREILRLLKQDCGACHGMRLTGGLGPALTPDALKDRPAASLVATIVSGRPGPGFFMRSHENTPYAWVDSFNSANKDVLQVIDKQSLDVVATLKPAPGKTTAHVEFTRDGRYALASVWEMDGALIVYDAATLKEVKRIPMAKPSGKYNVYNKTSRSAGTSH